MTSKALYTADIFTHLASIKGLADSMTNICNCYAVGEHVEAQIYAHTDAIILLAEKVEGKTIQVDGLEL